MEIKARILVVDDNYVLGASIKDILEENDYLAECAANGKEAIELARNNKYDIALIDIKLPDISGNEVVEKIAEISPSTDFIYMTGHASINSAIEAVKQKNVVAYETKPLNLDHLLPFINQVVKRKQSEEELHVKNSYIKLLQIAAIAANTAAEIDDAFHPILEEICRYTGWQIGHVYIVSKDDPDLLKPTEVWRLDDKEYFKEFCSVTEKTIFAKGVGLPGRVLADCKPLWIVDVTKDKGFLRTKIAGDMHIKSGIAFPVMVGAKVVAVMEFFTTDAIAPDHQFMDIMADMGTQLGRAIERKTAEERIKTSLREKEVLLIERMRAEEKIKASLKEKEVLLKEIHHRVKNNMQVMASLLRLQSREIKDKHLLDLFNESQNRIKSMALIHEDLYQGKDLAGIDLNQYTRKLTGRLTMSYGVDPNRIITSVNIDNVFLGVDKAIPCGLILNELFTNSLKYAFPHIITDVEHILEEDDDRERSMNKGEIRIDCHYNSDEYTLVFSDNGVGLPEDLDFHKMETLGLDLVRTLVEQLKGTIELNRSGGTEFTITFRP